MFSCDLFRIFMFTKTLKSENKIPNQSYRQSVGYNFTNNK